MIGAQGYLTKGPHIDAEVRREKEDFLVYECPMIFPGRQTCALIEKRGISTTAAVRRIATALDLPDKRITYAGLKDAKAITRQWISVGVPESKLSGMDLGNVKVLETKQGCVRFGQLEGNRFIIRLRCDESHIDQIKETFAELEKRGVPNFFGWQRFGSRRPNTHLVGWAAAARDYQKAIDLYLGNPYPKESPALITARTLYDEGKLKESLAAFPRKFLYERNMIRALIKNKTACQTYKTLPPKMQMLMIGAADAEVFNKIISWRLPDIDKLRVGDIARTTHRVFTVKEPEKYTDDLLNFKISPTAAFGSCRYAENEQGDLEKKLAEGLPLGFRREMRFKVQDINVRLDEGVVVEFKIPKGCYATAVVRELIK